MDRGELCELAGRHEDRGDELPPGGVGEDAGQGFSAGRPERRREKIAEEPGACSDEGAEVRVRHKVEPGFPRDISECVARRGGRPIRIGQQSRVGGARDGFGRSVERPTYENDKARRNESHAYHFERRDRLAQKKSCKEHGEERVEALDRRGSDGPEVSDRPVEQRPSEHDRENARRANHPAPRRKPCRPNGSSGAPAITIQTLAAANAVTMTESRAPLLPAALREPFATATLPTAKEKPDASANASPIPAIAAPYCSRVVLDCGRSLRQITSSLSRRNPPLGRSSVSIPGAPDRPSPWSRNGSGHGGASDGPNASRPCGPYQRHGSVGALAASFAIGAAARLIRATRSIP